MYPKKSNISQRYLNERVYVVLRSSLLYFFFTVVVLLLKTGRKNNRQGTELSKLTCGWETVRRHQ